MADLIKCVVQCPDCRMMWPSLITPRDTIAVDVECTCGTTLVLTVVRPKHRVQGVLVKRIRTMKG